MKQRRERKAKKLSVICNICSAEYHISCLIQAYKDFRLGQTKSQRTLANKQDIRYSFDKRTGAKSIQSVAVAAR